MRRTFVVDNFFADVEKERSLAISAEYRDTEHLGLIYPGIAIAPDSASEEKLRQLLTLKGGTFTTFFRRYLPTEKSVTFIHNDCHIGTVTAIAFLTTPAACSGGLALWRHRVYGWEKQPSSADIAPLGLDDTPEFWEAIHREGFDEKRWEMVDYVAMFQNRLVAFDSARYHSRYPRELIGAGIGDCRLIKTFFWKADPC